MANYAYKTYKIAMLRNGASNANKIAELESRVIQLTHRISQQKALEERLGVLEEEVLYGDFKLKKEFKSLEEEMVEKKTS